MKRNKNLQFTHAKNKVTSPTPSVCFVFKMQKKQRMDIHGNVCNLEGKHNSLAALDTEAHRL